MEDAVTNLLSRWNSGDGQSREALMGLLYDEMRAIAGHALRNEKQGHVLQPTALVHEAFLKLVDTNRIEWKDRGHFLAVATTIMRQILVDAARRAQAGKRDWGRQVTFTGGLLGSGDPDYDLLALDDAMNKLRTMRPELCQLVDLRFFGGLTLDECVEVMGESRTTVKRRWRTARAWLAKDLAERHA